MNEFLYDYWWRILAVAVISYLIGSFSFSIVYTRLVRHEDIRNMGSGNAGFTNVLRSVGVVPAVITFACDLLKGIVAVLIGRFVFDLQFDGLSGSAEVLNREYIMYGMFIAGLCCIVGHSFPVYYGFKGGKGVTTTAAMLLVIDWRIMLMSLAVFLIVFLFTRIISISSIIGEFSIGVSTFVINYFVIYKPSLATVSPYSIDFVIATTCMAFAIGLFVIIKHHENIKRLLRGEEKKIRAKKA